MEGYDDYVRKESFDASCLTQVRVATAPMSLDMSGWAALGETNAAPAVSTGSLKQADAESCSGSASQMREMPLDEHEANADGRPRAESQLGSIAAWQAIAADVSYASNLLTLLWNEECSGKGMPRGLDVLL